MAVTDFTIDYVNKVIDNPAGSVVHSVNEIYSYLQETFDDLGQLDDDVPMSAQTPTSYTMVNGWYITDRATKLMNGGAIQTSGYLNEIYTVTFTANAGAIETDRTKQTTGSTTGAIGTLLDFSEDGTQWFIRTGGVVSLTGGETISVVSGTGSGTESANATGETIYANPYTLGTLDATNGSPQLYLFQAGSRLTNTGWFGTGHFDILVKVRDAGTDIDARKIIVFSRGWGDNYSHFEITLTTAGQNAVPLNSTNDLNTSTAEATVASWAAAAIGGTAATYSIDINVNLGGFSYDIGDGNGNQTYDVQIDCNGQSLSKVYEVAKWATRTGATTELSTGIQGQEYVSANAGTYAEVVTAPFGTFAGGKFFGARGVYFINLNGADAQNFQLIDAAGTTRNPPNYQAFQVGGLENGDTVAVFKSTGSQSTAVDKAQFSLNGANPLNTITVTGSIPTSTPSSGTIIVVDTNGTETVYAYSAWSGSNFTVVAGAGTHDGTETAYVPYIYVTATGTAPITVSETSTIWTSDINVVTVARQAGFIPFTIAGSYGSTGFSTTAIRTADGIYQ